MSVKPRDLGQESWQAFENAARSAPSRPSDRQIVREWLPEIRRKRQAGWSYAEIRVALSETQGFAGTLSSLYSYVSKLSKTVESQCNAPSTGPTSQPVPPPRPRRVADLCGSFGDSDQYPGPTKKKRKRSLVDILNKPL